MTTIKEALFSRLSGFAGLASLVQARIYPAPLPQGATLPAVTYQRISGARDHAISGKSSLARPRYQLDSWASTDLTAEAVAEQVRQALDGFAGTMGSGPGIAASARLDNDHDDYDPETQTHRVIADYFIFYEENTP